jgi:hypothetical protein
LVFSVWPFNKLVCQHILNKTQNIEHQTTDEFDFLRIHQRLICAGVAQLVELQPSKLNVASSNLVSRSRLNIHSLKDFEAV